MSYISSLFTTLSFNDCCNYLITISAFHRAVSMSISAERLQILTEAVSDSECHIVAYYAFHRVCIAVADTGRAPGNVPRAPPPKSEQMCV